MHQRNGVVSGRKPTRDGKRRHKVRSLSSTSHTKADVSSRICIWKMGGEESIGPNHSGYHDPTSDCPDISPKLHLGLEEVIHTGHRSNIFSVKWSPVSSRRLFSCSGDDTRVFDLSRSQPSYTCREGTSTWSEWDHLPAGTNGALLKVFKCHTDRVKRIAVFEDSNDVFLTCSEDGTVRQHDLRVPHTCSTSRDREACGPPIVSYAEAGISLYTLSISKMAPWLFVVGGTSPYVFLRALPPFLSFTPYSLY